MKTDSGIIKIWLEYVYPPIPDRRNDWCAYIDGYEENQYYGRGKTKWEALHDLIENLEDQE